MIYLLSFLAFWLACGFVAAGFVYGHDQGEFPDSANEYRDADRSHAWYVVRWGMMALLVIMFDGDFRYGWRKWW